MTRFTIVPVTLRAANAYVTRYHRHHKPTRGHRFSVGLAALPDRQLVGVAIIGRPVARGCDPETTAEVLRCCTDGTKDACSALYGAAARAAKALGYRQIQTYTPATEPGTSLRAAGWREDGTVRGRPWEHSSERQLRLDGSTRRQDQPTTDKRRWVRDL